MPKQDKRVLVDEIQIPLEKRRVLEDLLPPQLFNTLDKEYRKEVQANIASKNIISWLPRWCTHYDNAFLKAGYRLSVFIFMALSLWIMEASPEIQFNSHWRQQRISYMKTYRLSCSFTRNVLVLLCKSMLTALIPGLAACLMSCSAGGGAKRWLQVRAPGPKGKTQLLPVNVNVYALCVMPFFVQFGLNFKNFVLDTILAYTNQFYMTDQYHVLRMLIYAIHIMLVGYGLHLCCLCFDLLKGMYYSYGAYCKAVAANKQTEDVHEKSAAFESKVKYGEIYRNDSMIRVRANKAWTPSREIPLEH